MAVAASRTGLARPQGFHAAPTPAIRRTAVCVRAEKTPTVGKAVLVDKIAKEASITKAEATKAFDTLIDAVQEAVNSGQKVTIIGFGTFETRSRAGRNGRNPKTGEPITIPPSKAPAFRPSESFKAQVNGKAAPKPAAPKAAEPAAPKVSAPKPAAAKPAAAAPKPAAAPRPVTPAMRRPPTPPPKGKK